MNQNRREFMGAAGVALTAAGAIAAASPAAAEGAQPAGPGAALEAAFRAAFEGVLNADNRLAFIADNAIIISHDVPFHLDKAAYADHLAFHAASWEKLELMPERLTAKVHGETGVVSCYYNERGKPKNSGFRQAPGSLIAVCERTGQGWRAIGLSTSPMTAQILDASPS